MTPGYLAEAPELLNQQRNRVMGIPPGRTRQYPDARPADQPGLATDACRFLVEGYAIGSHAQDGHPVGSIPADFMRELPSAFLQLIVGEFSRACGRTMDKIGQPYAPVEKFRFFLREEDPWGKAAKVECFPEAAAGMSEMVASGRGSEPGIYADKQDVKLPTDDIRNELPFHCRHVPLVE